MTSPLPLRIAFMGTPDFAVVALDALVTAGHHIAAVYTQPPKPVGRGMPIQQTPVHLRADALGFEIHTPKTLRDAVEQKTFVDLNLDVAVVAAYGLILPEPILSAPRWGCLNIHGSLLPRWRGAAPIQRAILAGDAVTGITIMQMDAGLDTGAMLLTDTVPITPDTTATSLHDRLASMGGRLIVQALHNKSLGHLQPVAQSEDGVTYAHKLTREDGRIEWTSMAAQIERQVRALNPWPGCYFSLNGEKVKVWSVTLVPSMKGVPGTLLAPDFTIACGDHAVTLTSVQRPGKKITDGASLLRGLRMDVGALL